MSFVWYNPARGLCSPGYALILRTVWGAYYHGNGGCQTVDNGIVFRESRLTSEKKSRNADIKSHGEHSCANPRRLEFCSRTDPESDQVYSALDLEHHRGRDDVLY